VNLRGESSAPVAEVLAGRGVPFVFLTGYAPGNIPERFRDRPALRKPHGKAEVVAALAAAAGRDPAAG
jgi:hypothetical protein